MIINEDNSKCKTLTLRRLDLSSSDSNSVTQSNFHKGEGGVVKPDSGKGSSNKSGTLSKQSKRSVEFKENQYVNDSDSEILHDSAIKDSDRSDSIL